ncbi:MAG: hydrogenase maturation nickel metallochaperone HypA [Nanobdellota archaeon]
MHELAIARELLNMVAENCGEKVPRRVYCRLGVMTTYKREPLTFYFNELKGDSIAASAELVVTEVDGVLQCDDCNTSGEVSDPYDMFCQACGSGNTRIIEGKDLVIEKIEVE